MKISIPTPAADALTAYAVNTSASTTCAPTFFARTMAARRGPKSSTAFPMARL
jgi:hypothetical protein